MIRSLHGLVVAFAAGILLSRALPSLPGPTALVGLAAAATILSLLLSRFHRGFLAGLWIALAALGAMRAQSCERSYADLYRRAASLQEVTGAVASYPNSEPGRTTFYLAPDQLPARLQVSIFWGDGPAGTLLYGDRLRLRGSVKAPPRFPDFDYRAYLAEQGVFAVMTVDGADDLERVGQGGSPILRTGNALRNGVLSRLDQALSADDAALAHGLLFGMTTGLSEEVSDAFRRTGLSHLLAISGMNLAVLLAGLWFALRLCGLRPVVSYPLVGVGVLGILWLVGLPVSLVRAAIMFGFLAVGSVLSDLGLILHRSVHLDRGLSAAALLILAIRPTALFDVGFQLSFGATAAILAWASLASRSASPPDRTWRRGLCQRCLEYGRDSIAVSLAAQAGTAPFLAWQFGMLYPFGLFANLLVVPLATVTSWVGVVAVFLCATPLLPPAAAVFRALLSTMTWAVRTLARLPLTAVAVDAQFALVLTGTCLYAFATRAILRGPTGLDTPASPR